jgi:cell division septation protein DedD
VLPWANGGPASGGATAPRVPAVSAPVTASVGAGAPQSNAVPGGNAAAPIATKKVAALGRPGGAFRIQVAAVKSRDEASAVISKIQAAGGSLASASSTVDETTFGAMGTFYRVRLGPYANAAAAKPDCDALKASGLDCLVTAK